MKNRARRATATVRANLVFMARSISSGKDGWKAGGGLTLATAGWAEYLAETGMKKNAKPAARNRKGELCDTGGALCVLSGWLKAFGWVLN